MGIQQADVLLCCYLKLKLVKYMLDQGPVSLNLLRP